MAEGFFQTSKRSFSVIEDIGNKYYDCLMANSLFQDLEKDFCGDITRCKMHDLALSISKRETLHLEDNLRDDIDVSHIQHLSLISDGHTTHAIPLSKDGTSRLHIIFLIGADLGDKLLDFKYLRGLSLSGPCIKELPESICNFIHLRLLRIKRTSDKALPKSLTKLYNLHTLRIDYCPCLKELPKDLQNLISLRHLDIDHQYIEQLPINMGRLTCLQTLHFFVKTLVIELKN